MNALLRWRIHCRPRWVLYGICVCGNRRKRGEWYLTRWECDPIRRTYHDNGDKDVQDGEQALPIGTHSTNIGSVLHVPIGTICLPPTAAHTNKCPGLSLFGRGKETEGPVSTVETFLSSLPPCTPPTQITMDTTTNTTPPTQQQDQQQNGGRCCGGLFSNKLKKSTICTVDISVTMTLTTHEWTPPTQNHTMTLAHNVAMHI